MLMTQNKQDQLTKICDNVLSKASFDIDEKRKDAICSFIEKTVNEDTITESLTIESSLSKNVLGVIVYVLTSDLVVKIYIGENDIYSSSFTISSIMGVERRVNDGRAEIEVLFPNDSIGLRYNSDNEDITDFFQKIDQARL